MTDQLYPEHGHDLGYIYTVSSLTKELKSLIEEAYPFIWVTGEISNCALPASGHIYFSLKDKDALIHCVMFRNQKKRLLFNLENGMKITGIGRLSLYEPRGSYQLIFEHIDAEGMGDLQIFFEQLKKKLALEGLFDEKHKKKIPFLPSKISIITSPSGAVIRDIIDVSQRRFPGIHLEVVPVKVQGENADLEIKNAIELINKMVKSPPVLSGLPTDFDQSTDLVIIIARGGGSLEDLSAFNSEIVARAVFESEIPVISAVGHETDYTICDFVADLRAPTPSVAAEMAVPEKKALLKSIFTLRYQMTGVLQFKVAEFKKQVKALNLRLKNPIHKVHDMRFKSEWLEQRMLSRIVEILKHHQQRVEWFTHSLLYVNHPQKKIVELRRETERISTRLSIAMSKIIDQYRTKTVSNKLKLEALSPTSVLKRGYSITRHLGNGQILRNAADADQGEDVEVLLSKGKMVCQVNKTIL
ncbi:MAG: exodeoxyribonuclease VII large subunit [Desulfamplus sp.]|nr:exodeoxyribonuclease VII large subunit [Desulfamplus sp.]